MEHKGDSERAHPLGSTCNYSLEFAGWYIECPPEENPNDPDNDDGGVNIYDDNYVLSNSFWNDISNPPCWQEVLGKHKSNAVYLDDWCDYFDNLSFNDLNQLGFFGPVGSQPGGPIDDYRYVIDMRHFLYVGFYLDQLTGVGNAAGDIIELGQLFTGDEDSALDWQDFFQIGWVPTLVEIHFQVTMEMVLQMKFVIF